MSDLYLCAVFRREELRDRSLFIAWRGGITCFLGEQKGGLVVTENPKGGVTGNSWKDSEGGPLKFAWKMKTWGRGDGESHQMLSGGITSVK